jgi:hypothetical protein
VADESSQEIRTQLSKLFGRGSQAPEGTHRLAGSRHFGKAFGVTAKGKPYATKTFLRSQEDKGYGGLKHSLEGGFSYKGKAGVTERLGFSATRVSEAAVDEYIRDHKITDEMFTEEFMTPASSMIAAIQYAPSRLMMRVTFKNDDAVVDYGRVPPNVYAELLAVFQRGGSVGKRFWTVIRQYSPGNFVKYGSKYPFLYRSEGKTLHEINPMTGQRLKEDQKEALTEAQSMLEELKRMRQGQSMLGFAQ